MKTICPQPATKNVKCQCKNKGRRTTLHGKNCVLSQCSKSHKTVRDRQNGHDNKLAQFGTLQTMSLDRAVAIYESAVHLDMLEPAQNSVTSDVRQFLKKHDYWIKLVEDVMIYYYQSVRSNSAADLIIATVNFAKLRSGRAIFSDENLAKLESYVSKLFRSDLQSNIDWYAELKGGLQKYEMFRNSPVFTKVYKLMTYAMSLSVFDGVGLSLDKFYPKVEAEALRKKHFMGPDFLHCVLSTITFLVDRGAQCLKTGSMDPIFHSSSEYDKFFELYARLKRESSLLGNPEVHGINVFQHYADVKDAIEKSEAILKYSISMDKLEKRLMSKLVNDLKLLDAEELTKRAARASRAAPFAVSVFGASSIGKSTFTEILFLHFGKLFSLPTEPEFKYTRNANAKYWDGFSTYQWCLNLDDIAFMHPDIASAGGDPSLMELIMAINQTCFVPDQADLADKGRTPMKCDLVIGSTNTPHLNAHFYYSCPIALMRRLPFLIDLKVKAEFSDENGMLDSTKVPPQAPGSYMDVWDIELHKIENVPSQGTDPRIGARGRYVLAYKFDSIYKFLKMFGDLAKVHRHNQSRVKSSIIEMKNIQLCNKCDVPQNHCICEDLQGTDISALSKVSVEDAEASRCQEVEIETHKGKKKQPIFNRNMSTLQGGMTLVPFAITPNVHVQIQNLQAAQENTNDCWALVKTMSYFEIANSLFIMFVLWLCWTIPWIGNGIIYPRLPKVWLQRSLMAPIWGVRFQREALRILGSRIQARIGVPKKIMQGLAIAGSVGLVYACLKPLISKMQPIPEEEKKNHFMYDPKLSCKKCLERNSRQEVCGSDCSKITEPFFKQRVGNYVVVDRKCEQCLKENTGKIVCGLSCEKIYPFYQSADLVEFGRKPVPTSFEKENPWFKQKYEVSPLDITPITKTFKGKLEEFDNNVLRSSAYFQFKFNGIMRIARAVNVKGHIWLMNLHCTPPEHIKACRLNYITQNVSEGVSQNYEFLFSTHEITRFPEQDLALVNIPQLHAGRDITNYFVEETLQGYHKGYYLSKNCEGSVFRKRVDNIKLYLNQPVNGLEQNLDLWEGYVETPTEVGQCGSSLITQTREGPIILGIHSIGYDNTCGATRVTRQFLQQNIKEGISKGHTLLSSESKEIKLVDLNDKCPLKWIEDGSAIAYGSLEGFRGLGKSHVRESVLCDSMLKRGYKQKYTAPKMMGYEPWRIAMVDMTHPATNINTTILDECIASFSEDILSTLDASELAEIFVYDVQTAINGAKGVTYVDRMNMKSSMGFPWKKSKRHFIIGEDPMADTEVIFTPEIMNRAKDYERRYRLGERVHPIFSGCLKDEAVSLKKAAIGKTRVFTCAAGDWSIVVRMYCLAFTRVMQRNGILFEAAPGTIAQSTEWERLYHYITKHGRNRIVAGDYKAFDKSMPAVIILAAFRIIINICKAAGYNDEELRVLNGIAEDTAFPEIDMNGNMMSFYGSNPSGHPLTVVINSLANALYMRYAYIMCGYDVSNFKQDVALLTYGDDNIMSVNPQCDKFNHTAIQASLAFIGITYTMADKESESVPFVDIDEVSFLKRKWLWDDEVGAFLAPLEEESIIKSLMINVASDTISAEHQALEVVGSAMREFFFHGRPKFEAMELMLREIVAENKLSMYITDSTFPTFRSLKEQFWNNSRHVDIEAIRNGTLQGLDIPEPQVVIDIGEECAICEMTVFEDANLLRTTDGRCICDICLLYRMSTCHYCSCFYTGTHVCEEL